MLVDGFEYPPMMMCPHHTRYQKDVAEAAGLQKAIDLIGGRYTVGELPARVLRAREKVDAMPEVKIRTLDKRKAESELELLLEVWDDAWKDNWVTSR